MMNLKQMALDEYNSPITTARHGTNGGIFWCTGRNKSNGERYRPFWNVYASQFMFNPCFEFAPLPGCIRYRFLATDCNKQVHTFEAESPLSLLTPIWGDLPEGYVELKVEALEDDGTPISLVGARTFYRQAPFAGPDAYPPKARSYRECARMAFRFCFETPSVRYWLDHGVPDPAYDLNVYPSKMIASIIQAMITYASLEPENAENAIQLAKNAADYLLSITIDDGPLKGLPPTYYTEFRKVIPNADNRVADELGDTVMMVYPSSVGYSYLKLEQATGEARYLEAAKKIGEYYRQNVLENGSWPLVVSIETGKRLNDNDCMPDGIIPFLNKMHERTGETIWKELAENAHAYRVRSRMDSYNWEGQFEDSPMSAHYSNLTHFGADNMIVYIAEHQKDDPDAIAQAEDLMRFVEDQFVVWSKHARKTRSIWLNDPAEWHTPAGLEQYNWYVPIDSSTSGIMNAFLHLYKATGKPLLLAKACALADSITRVQNPETGMIPTHWMSEKNLKGDDFWINCHISVAICMANMANETE